MNRLKLLSLFAGCLLAIFTLAQAAEPVFRLTGKQSLAGSVRWDYLSFDAPGNRLFITRGDHVDVYDTVLAQVTGTILDTPGVHGVALAPDLNRGYTSNGLNSSVTVFEMATLRPLGTFPTEKKPDAIIYDPATKRVFVANGDSGTLTVIDAIAQKSVGTVSIGGKLEFAAVDGSGLLFVNVEDRNAIAVVNTRSLKVVATHDISSGCEEPTGLSIDVATQRLFVGCRNEKMAVVSAKTGKILASVPVGKGCDATAFDPGLNLAFASAGDGTLTIVSGTDYAARQVVSTQPTARTMALDEVHHRAYTVAAEREEPTAAGGRPKLKDGSFALITVGL
jgi:DNA-binding beta-propeller fold protein YncE